MPGKNIMILERKPLIAYSIEQARKSSYIDKIIVSTDDEEIAQISREYGAEVPFIRPKELAQDDSSSIDVLLHAMLFMENEAQFLFNILLLLQVTSPLRYTQDIDNCIELLVSEKADNVFSVTKAHSNPYFNMIERNEEGKVRLVKDGAFTTRQSAPAIFELNGSIYVWWKNILEEKKCVFMENSRAFVMPRERSVDIDDLLDFKIVKALMLEKKD